MAQYSSRDPKITYISRLILFLVVAFTLHNIEEFAGDLAGWLHDQSITTQTLEPALLLSALVGITITAWLIYLTFRKWGELPSVQVISAMMSATLVANALSHIVLSLVYISFMPGIYTAVLFVLPIAVLSLIHLVQELEYGWVGLILLLTAGFVLQVLVPLVSVMSLVVLV